VSSKEQQRNEDVEEILQVKPINISDRILENRKIPSGNALEESNQIVSKTNLELYFTKKEC
jgi:hypothetical protein